MRLTKEKEIDATAYDENNMMKKPAFKKEDLRKALDGTIETIQNQIVDDKSILADSHDLEHIEFRKGRIESGLDSINLIKESFPVFYKD